ncbi:MAG: hypothetical protein AB7P03_16910 [Kofleriaceae bacterium]
MRGVAVGLVLLAACSDPNGWTIEIAAPGAATVELFLGERDCVTSFGSPCTYIRPPELSQRKFGEGHFLDTDVLQPVPVEGGTAVIRLESPSGDDTLLHRVVIIGFDGSHTPVGALAIDQAVLVPADEPLYWKLALDPWAQIEDSYPTPPEPGDRFRVWRRADDQLAACVLVERWNGSEGEYDFLVPESDTDCDDVVTECDAFTYLSSSTFGDRGRANCVTIEPITQACRLAGPVCSETMPAQLDTCTPTQLPYCFSDRFCTSCLPGAVYPDCMADALATFTDDDAHVTCNYVADDNGICSDGEIYKQEIDLTPMINLAGRTECESIKLLDLTVAPPFAFSDTVDFMTGDSFKAHFESPCTVRLEWLSTAAMMTPVTALFDVSLMDRHLIVPVTITFTHDPACLPDTAGCTATAPQDTVDRMFECAM